MLWSNALAVAGMQDHKGFMQLQGPHKKDMFDLYGMLCNGTSLWPGPHWRRIRGSRKLEGGPRHRHQAPEIRIEASYLTVNKTAWSVSKAQGVERRR